MDESATCITPTILDTDGNNPDDERRLKAIETPWFTLPDPQEKNGDGASACGASKCFPSTITVSLMQVGNGSPDFDRAHTELDNGTKGLTDALNKIIEANAAK
ncbi:hypothetical protein N5J06_20120 [Ralstonia sp. CHL-2022]|uniref:Uncharacterized protein n=1 Tax=Ralstonia mojiangensis TaxID=2953895 RepID=A0ABT2LCY8_9RALS|nr:hypothetical protein [Ralstonia mojiangensis]MCT7313287.1 hypothetical protein [Ralstonia mojiangensis]